MSRTILYYPNINIPNNEWLKKTILFWNHISSIVPDREYYQHCIVDKQNDMRYLIENEIYRPVFPSMLFESNKYNDFNDDLEKAIKEHIGQHNNEQSESYGRKQRRPVHRKKLAFPELASKVHYKKFDNQIFEYLLEQELIVDYGDEWVSMDEKLATIYMSRIAKYLSNLSPTATVVGTDKNKYLYYAYSRTYKSKNNLAFNVCFQNALPEPSPDVSIKDIVKFKQKRALELIEFQHELLQFENQLAKCTSIDEANSELELFQIKIQKSILELEKIYKDERISYRFGTMKSLVETGGAAATISSLGQLPTWAKIVSLCAGGLLGFGCSYLQHNNTLNQARQTNGFAYLYDLNNYNMIRKKTSEE